MKNREATSVVCKIENPEVLKIEEVYYKEIAHLGSYLIPRHIYYLRSHEKSSDFLFGESGERKIHAAEFQEL